MKTNKRAERRARSQKAKQRAQRRLERNGVAHTAAIVGKNAATHGTCDCWMCAPRGYFGRELTMQELRQTTLTDLLKELD